MRRAHRKSRLGCRVCKLRHIKCDESKPSCLNCLAVERRCAYLDDTSTNLQTPNSTPTRTSSRSPGPSPAPSPRAHYEATQSHPAALGEDYTLTHLELFYHFATRLAGDLVPDPVTRTSFTDLAVRESLSTPYLMDELLALSAAHKSTLHPDRRDFYLAEATRLQTRGLSRHNAVQTELSDDNCVAVFMYSALLGQHVLFDTFSLQGDFPAVITKLVQCLSLHRGIRTIATNSSEETLRQLLGGDLSHLEPLGPVQSGDESALLWDQIDGSQLSDSSKHDCQEAVKALQGMFSRQRLGRMRDALTVQEWAVRVPTGYVELLNQRRPEALVVLAYYAVLLHRERTYWSIGSTGSYLIRSITSNLGEYWKEWLEWPNRVLMEDPIVSGISLT